MNPANQLEKCSDFPCIFELVKTAVEETIGRRRTGLILGLLNLPIHIGAFHQIGSNFIVMNKRLLEEVIRTDDRKIMNSYIFHILLHEYLHSLGFINEEKTNILTYAISEKIFGSNHPTTLIAKYGIGSVLSNLNRIRDYKPRETMSIEIIEDFETDNLSYIG